MPRVFFLLIAILIACFHLHAEQTPLGKEVSKYNLSVCAVFKNESKYLKEWIEYHRLIGVDHFYLYNNNSVDRSLSVLKPYIEKGIVTLIHWPDRVNEQCEKFVWPLGIQVSAYENAIKWVAPQETKWLAILDIDEFLIPIGGYTLNEMLKKYSQYPGVVLSRTFYDASLVNAFPKKNLVIESLEIIGTPSRESPLKRVEKMIFNPRLCDTFTWPPYRCIFKDLQKPIVLTKWELRVNHYSNRNKGYLVVSENPKKRVPMDHRSMQEDALGELLETGYTIEDQEKAIYRFVPDVLKKMGY